MSLQTGQILQQRYHIVSHVGQGGMGAVYQAQDSRLGNRLVAVKEFDPARPQLSVQDRQAALQAFQQEAAILSGLSHPSLTAVYDYFLENNNFYLVMEFVQGETLAQAWRRSGQRFAEAQVITWAEELCNVLGYLHGQHPPIIFRDLKPDNIIVQPDGYLKLIDFGIARHFTPGKTSDTTRFGTPGYAAPEQYGRGQTDARSDIYALGVIMHQLLTGYDPTSTPFHLPAIEQLAPQVSPPVKQTITQALEMEPAKRPLTTQLFLTTLKQSARMGTVATLKAGSIMPAWAWTLIIGLFLLLPLGIWLTRDDQSAQTTSEPETIVVTRLVTLPAEVAEPGSEPEPTPLPTNTIRPTNTPQPTETARPTDTPTPQPTEPSRTADLSRTAAEPLITAAVEARRVAQPPGIDGELIEWNGFPAYLSAYPVYTHPARSSNVRDPEGFWHLAWDDQYLFLAVTVYDEVHVQTQSGTQIYRGDSVEIQINTNPAAGLDYVTSAVFQIIISPGDFAGLPPSVVRFRGNEQRHIGEAPGHAIRIAARQTGTGYQLEAAVPWADLSVIPYAGLVLGLALNVNSNDTPNTAVQEVMVSNVPSRTLTNPATWGTLTLGP